MDTNIDELKKRLNAKTIHDLRQIGRAVGVVRPADGKKDRLVDCILLIASGKADPAAPAVRGAHPKSQEYDRQIVADILRCRETSLSGNVQDMQAVTEISVGSGTESDALDFIANGILEKCDGRWFMRPNGRREKFFTRVIVNEFFINNYGLRAGDMICGQCKRTSVDEAAGLAVLHSVNGLSPDASRKRRRYEELTPLYPDKRIYTETEGDLICRIADLLSPLAAGQRALVSGRRGSGKTTVLKKLAAGIRKNNPDFKLILLLIDCAPEQESDFRRSFPDCDVFTSTYDAGAQFHVSTVTFVLEYAKRLLEAGRDVVLVFDNLTSLARAYALCSKQFSVIAPAAIDEVKKFFAAARNAEEGGSLTILTAMNTDTENRLEESLVSELKRMCNMRFALADEIADIRIFPSVDVKNTYTVWDENLLSEEERHTAAQIREMPFAEAAGVVLRTKNNAELCDTLKR